eukprot:7944876-Alexandrium_andersonii.AAC.1
MPAPCGGMSFGTCTRSRLGGASPPGARLLRSLTPAPQTPRALPSAGASCGAESRARHLRYAPHLD